MTKLLFGDVVLLGMRFHQTEGSKVRPAVVLLDTGDDDVVAAPITSRTRESEFDVEIQEWRRAGLNVACRIRVDKAAVLAKSDILRSLGRLQDSDAASLGETACRAYCRR